MCGVITFMFFRKSIKKISHKYYFIIKTHLIRIYVLAIIFSSREFSSKEIAMYNNLHGVEPVFIPTITTKVGITFLAVGYTFSSCIQAFEHFPHLFL